MTRELARKEAEFAFANVEGWWALVMLACSDSTICSEETKVMPGLDPFEGGYEDGTI